MFPIIDETKKGEKQALIKKVSSMNRSQQLKESLIRRSLDVLKKGKSNFLEVP